MLVCMHLYFFMDMDDSCNTKLKREQHDTKYITATF